MPIAQSQYSISGQWTKKKCMKFENECLCRCEDSSSKNERGQSYEKVPEWIVVRDRATDRPRDTTGYESASPAPVIVQSHDVYYDQVSPTDTRYDGK